MASKPNLPLLRISRLPASLLCALLAFGCGQEQSIRDGDDADGDGITNGDEGRAEGANTDMDEWEDWLDLDSDGDGVSDADEAGDDDLATPPVDSNGDGVADFRDPNYPAWGAGPTGDAGASGSSARDDDGDDDDGDGTPNGRDADDDGDGIDDRLESPQGIDLDSDGDGIPNRLDDDSDGDGIADSIEGSTDSDGDGIRDFLDVDSDDDGLADAEEDRDGDGTVDPCKGLPCESDRTKPDTDGDGVSDLVESVAGKDPTDEKSTIPEGDFYFVLPFQDPAQEGTLDFSTTLRRADIFFSVDTTGSFGEEIASIQASIDGLIVPGVRKVIPDAAFGVGRFEDFPLKPFGLPSDRPFEMLQSITTQDAAIRAGIDALPPAAGGLDTLEAGTEALFQWATGYGLPELGIAAFSDGVGGAGFRRDSLPILIQITDAASHPPEDYAAAGIKTRSHDQAVDALKAIGGRVIGVRSTENDGVGGDPLDELTAFALETRASIPPNAQGQCETGIDGTPREAVSQGGKDVCPLVFDVRPNGTGLGQILVDAVQQLASLATLDISSIPIGAPNGVRDEPLPIGTTTANFIEAITPEPPAPAGSTIDGDVFRGVTPGSTVRFRLRARNRFVPHKEKVQLFTVDIHVLGDAVTVLDVRKVYIVVPQALPEVVVL